MKQARLVVLPLNSEVTAGLIVLKNSILMGKPVIATETSATKNYFPEDCRDLLVPMGDVQEMAKALRRLWHDEETRLLKTKLLRDYIMHNYSPAVFAARVADLIAIASQ